MKKLFIFSAIQILFFSAQAKVDLITKVSTIKCKSDKHNFEFVWDSAITPFGPIKLIMDGKEIPLGGMRMTFEDNKMTYEVGGLNISFYSTDKDKNFNRIAKLNGVDIKFNCNSSEKMKFLRQRESAPTPEKSGTR